MQSLQSLCRAEVSRMVAETLDTLIFRYFSEQKITFLELVDEARKGMLNLNMNFLSGDCVDAVHEVSAAAYLLLLVVNNTTVPKIKLWITVELVPASFVRDCLRHLPAGLESISVACKSLGNDILRGLSESSAVATLKSLRLVYRATMRRDKPSNVSKRLVAMFKNLESLKIDCGLDADDDNGVNFWSNFPKLKILRCGKPDEGMFTGGNLTQLEQIYLPPLKAGEYAELATWMQSRAASTEFPALSVHVEGTYFGAAEGIPTEFDYHYIHHLRFTNAMAETMLMMLSSPAAPAINKVDLVVDRYSKLNEVCANVQALSLKLQQKDLATFSYVTSLPRSLEKLDISISFHNYGDRSKISTDDFVSAVSQNLPNLKKLKCSGLSRWSEAQIGSLFHNLTRLQQFEANGTFQIAAEGQTLESGEAEPVRFVRDKSSGLFTLAQWANVSPMLAFPGATADRRLQVAGGFENFIELAGRFYGVPQALPTLKKMFHIKQLRLWSADAATAAELLRSLPMLSIFSSVSLTNVDGLDWLRHPMLKNLSITGDCKTAGVTSLTVTKQTLPNLSCLMFRATCEHREGLPVVIDGLDDLLEVEITMKTRMQCSIVLRDLRALQSASFRKINIPSLVVENCSALVQFEVSSCRVPAKFEVPASLPQLAKEELATCGTF
eukprot:TRINITY_DN2972_c0_g1_i1.p1 TRINITY_DN2972_c0_g1~~TRINITY_DN2972_c0_g1_i1.p1  ORF type:complete len:667 (+),score=93.04 TRINITY_DN2972_c0_g1_i1:44-2044(+)